MAASSSSVDINTEKEGKQQDSDSEEGPECAVCLQTCVLPTRLPCRHVFCFLCAKGLALQSRRCAMCRADIPQEFLERPELLEPKQPKAGASNSKSNGEGATSQEELPPDKNYAWFYEGRNGWWQYEARLSEELETAYQDGSRTHDALIAGSIYTLDFNNWMQCRRDDPARRRRIKRDLASCQHKGVAGLRQLASGQGTNNNNNRTRMNLVVGNAQLNSPRNVTGMPQQQQQQQQNQQRTRTNHRNIQGGIYQHQSQQNTGGDGDGGSVPSQQATGVAQMQPPPQVGVPIQVHQQHTYMAIPVTVPTQQRTTQNQHTGQTNYQQPPIRRRATQTRGRGRNARRGVAQGRVNRTCAGAHAPNNIDLRRIIAAAANNAFNQGFGTGAALYGGTMAAEDTEEDSSEEPSDDDSDEQLRDFLFVRGGPYVLINNEPILIDSDSD